MQTFIYRLVEIVYRNRIEWEDGPGSLQNIVSDSSTKVIRTWEDQDDEFGLRLKKYGDATLHLSHDRPDGWVEYSYRLDRKPTDGDEWRFVDHLHPEDYDEDEY